MKSAGNWPGSTGLKSISDLIPDFSRVAGAIHELSVWTQVTGGRSYASSRSLIGVGVGIGVGVVVFHVVPFGTL